MGEIERESSRRARKNQVRDIILDSVKVAGILAIAMVAPNVIGGMNKLGLLPSGRQAELSGRSYRRLIAAGLLTLENKKFLRLTPKGESELRRIEARGYSIRKPQRWDKKWRVLIFDIPEYRKSTRNAIRATLQSIGFVRLQNSVWVYPFDCEDLIVLLKADFKVGKDMLYMVVDVIENDGPLRKNFGLAL